MSERLVVGVTRTSRYSFLVFILAAGFSGGCTSLPDTSGFTVATIQVKQAVVTSGDVVEGELRSAINAQATTATDNSVKRFKLAWRATTGSLDGMVEYAQSLEQIVDAGNAGADSVKQVADSVKNLADAVKVDVVTGATRKVIELSAETVAFVYGEYSKHLAAQSLEEALDKFSPSMAKITGLVEEQVADARRLFEEQIEAQVQMLEGGSFDDNAAGISYGNWIKRNRQLIGMSDTASKEFTAAIESNRHKMVEAAKSRISNIKSAQEIVRPRIEEYEEKLHTIRQREKVGRGVLEAARNTVGAWGTAHQRLVKSVSERKPVSVESLTAAVSEIRTLTQRWREL